MSRMFNTLMRKPLWVHLLAGLLVAVLLFLGWLASLNWFTDHGRSAVVPNLAGMKYEDAKSILEKGGFTVEVQDSIYTDTIPPLHVLRQSPESDEIVKSGRLIYLTLSRVVPPEVEMPSLQGQSFRNAEMILRSLDLRVGDTIYRADFARNSVLDQLYRGVPIRPGTKVRKGSLISLILGNGVGDLDMSVPDLIGMRFSEAKVVLERMGLGVGVLATEPNFTDTLNGFIQRQVPMPVQGDSIVNRIRTWQLVDLWIGSESARRDSL